MKLISAILVAFVCFSVNASNSKVDSLIYLLENYKQLQDQDRLYQIHFELGETYGSGGNEEYEKSGEHFSAAYKIAKKQKDFKKIGESLFGIALSHQRRNNFQEALEKYKMLIELNKGIIEPLKKASAFTQISSIYQALGDYEKAFENQMQALHLNEMKNDSLGIANSQYNIGTIFYYQTRYERAHNYYQKAYAICNALKNERFIYSCLAALGSVNEKLENYDKSLEYNTKSLELARKLNYKTGIAYALGNIAMNYLKQKDFIKAEQFLKESVGLKLDLEDKWGAIGTQIDLSKLYIQWQKPKQALPILEAALEMAKELNSKTRQLDIYKNMADVYDQLEAPVKAYSFTKKYIALKDSVLNEKTVEEMGQSKRRYELQTKEYEIAMLKKENELLGKNEKIQKLQIYIFAIAGLFFLSFLWWYKNKLKYQSDMNKLLEEKNEILNIKNEEINIKNKQLEYSNENLEQFAYVASHDLKEPLRMISSFSSLLERRYKKQLDETGREFIHFITDAVSRMDILLTDILDFSRAGNQKSSPEIVAVEDIMFTIEANLKYQLNQFNGQIITQSQNLPAIKVHRTQLTQLLQNLVSNGMKFRGERDPIVIVDCVKKKNNFVFSIKDNGIGISKENLEAVFEMFRRLNTRDRYEGSGIGLATCKKIVASWGGDIWTESVEGEGSTFLFHIPNHQCSSRARISMMFFNEVIYPSLLHKPMFQAKHLQLPPK